MQRPQKQFKSKITVADNSQLVNATIKKVLHDKIIHCVNHILEYKPHITWVSKNQLVQGHSNHFKDLPEQHPLRAGMISYWNRPGHLAVRRPTDAAFGAMEQKYGIVFPWPPLGLLDCVQTVFRYVMDKCIEDQATIAFAPCRGYINKEGKLVDPKWNKHEPWASQKISGYLIWSRNPEHTPIIQNFILNEADTRMYLQIERTRFTCNDIANTQITRGENIQHLAGMRKDSWACINELPSKEQIEDWAPYMIEDQTEPDDIILDDEE